MKILVTGSNGQVGSEIRKISSDFFFEWFFSDHDSIDFLILNQISKKLDKINPDIIVNCGAYTNVDNAETEFDIANTINNQAVGIISKWVSQNNSKLIHISTDYVFDGSSRIPLDEDCVTKPLNNYGLSKLNGELICIQNNPESIIIRTSWVYSSYGSNFLKTMINLMQKKEKIDVVCDQIGSPTYAGDLAKIILHIIDYDKWIPGIYNYSNEGKISWYDFAVAIRDICGFDVLINPVKSTHFVTKAKRPKYSLLNKDKIKRTYNIKIPYFKKSLKKCISILAYEK